MHAAKQRELGHFLSVRCLQARHAITAGAASKNRPHSVAQWQQPRSKIPVGRHITAGLAAGCEGGRAGIAKYLCLLNAPAVWRTARGATRHLVCDRSHNQLRSAGFERELGGLSGFHGADVWCRALEFERDDVAFGPADVTGNGDLMGRIIDAEHLHIALVPHPDDVAGCDRLPVAKVPRR